MRDLIIFPVVGSPYCEGGLLMAHLVSEGAILQLVHEPTNKFDSNAIKVMAFDGTEHIGYIPNKGFSCSVCWTHMDLRGTGCPSCGASWDFVVAGGLATRLVMTKSLEKGLACYVKSVDKNNKFSPIVAKLVLE